MNQCPDSARNQAQNTLPGRRRPPASFFGILSTVAAFGLGIGVANYLREFALLVILFALTVTVISLATIVRRNTPRPVWMAGICWTSWLILGSLVILIARRILA